MWSDDHLSEQKKEIEDLNLNKKQEIGCRS